MGEMRYAYRILARKFIERVLLGDPDADGMSTLQWRILTFYIKVKRGLKRKM
jgi:hypothetical protein